jgi:DNA mismatch repair ATPase MutS
MTEEDQNVSGDSMEAAAPVTDQVSDEQSEHVEERQVPLAALESERTQRQQLQDELRVIKDHLSLMQARQNQPAPPPEESYSDDDVMTFGEFKKLAGKFESNINQKLSEMEMAKKYPDYEEVVSKYLPEVIKEDPSIGESLRKSQDYRLAYRLARSSDSYRKDHKQQKKSADAERLVANSQRPGTLSSVGGTTPINMAKRYKDMNDDDFRREMNKNMGYA